MKEKLRKFLSDLWSMRREVNWLSDNAHNIECWRAEMADKQELLKSQTSALSITVRTQEKAMLELSAERADLLRRMEALEGKVSKLKGSIPQNEKSEVRGFVPLSVRKRQVEAAHRAKPNPSEINARAVKEPTSADSERQVRP